MSQEGRTEVPAVLHDIPMQYTDLQPDIQVSLYDLLHLARSERSPTASECGLPNTADRCAARFQSLNTIAR